MVQGGASEHAPLAVITPKAMQVRRGIRLDFLP